MAVRKAINHADFQKRMEMNYDKDTPILLLNVKVIHVSNIKAMLICMVLL